jgi:OFA family oxalate/formate antiporter-like MFS transporter
MHNDSLHSVKEIEEQPLYGWVVVIASFFVATMAYGGAYSFGVFLNPLREDFGWTSATTSGAFSFLLLSYSSLGILSGWGVDRFGPRITVGLGGLFIGLGLLLTSQIHTPWQIYLTYGLLIGPGLSTVYSPLLTTISRWFTKWRGLALGIVTAGTGAGSFIIPPFASHLISIYGWRLSYLILGTIVGGIIIIATLFLRKNPLRTWSVSNKQMPAEKVRTDNRMKDLRQNNIISEDGDFSFRRALNTKTFWQLCFMNLLVGFGLQMMMVHVVPYARESLKFSPMIAATVLSTIGASSIAGKLIMGGASVRIGVKRALAISTFMEGVMIIGMMSSSNVWILYLFASIFGFGYGGHVPQFPALTGDFFGLYRMGTILGAGTIFYGMGGAFSTFLAGRLFDITGSYTNAFSLGVLAMFLTTASTFFLKRPKK